MYGCMDERVKNTTCPATIFGHKIHSKMSHVVLAHDNVYQLTFLIFRTWSKRANLHQSW